MQYPWVRVTRVSHRGVWVEPLEPQASLGCKACACKSGCASLWAHASSSKKLFLETWQIKPRSSAGLPKVGQSLLMSYPDETRLLGACLIFGLPLLGVLLGLGGSVWVVELTGFSSDFTGLVGVVSGLVISTRLLKGMSDNFLRDRLFPTASVQASRSQIGYTKFFSSD